MKNKFIMRTNNIALIFIFFLTFSAFSVFYSNSYGQDTSPSHYYDDSGNLLAQYDFILKRLSEEYGNYVPKKIIIKTWSEAYSKFSPEKNTIIISNTHLKNDPIREIAHESAHLCNYNMSMGASILTPFRFIDEGYASIIENLINNSNSEKEYQESAIRIASIQKRKNNVSFDKVQAWEKYYGGPGINSNLYAYPVGSSFDYFIINKYSKEKFHLFLKDLGITKNLESSIQNIFSTSILLMEKKWLESLNRDSDVVKVKVVEMFPANNETNIDVNIKEIFVKFNVDMNNFICVATKCNDGICYKNAYWKDKTTLIIKIDPKLLQNHKYNITLGALNRCHLISVYREELPVTDWTFQTK